jgi:ankyrin repeat protein
VEACVQGGIESAQLLIAAGAKVNLRNRYDNSPLHVAAQNNHRAICEMLIAHKADVMLLNYENKNCKDLAEDQRHGELVDLLDYHLKRETMWRNRNCLLKIADSRDRARGEFKGLPQHLFREIIKYA